MGFKKYKTYNMNDNVFGKEYKVYNYEEKEDRNIYYLKSNEINGICPHCGCISNKIHSTCTRTIQYIPVHLKATYININFLNLNV